MLRFDDQLFDDGRSARFAPRRDLPALIELYEANYVRLMNLAPDLETLPPIGGYATPRRSNEGTGWSHADGLSESLTADLADKLADKFTMVSNVAGAMDLHLTVIERHRFTTTINLSYLFRHDLFRHELSGCTSSHAVHNEPGAPGAKSVAGKPVYSGITNADDLDEDDNNLVLEPNARLCIYHDVRAVELLSHYRRKRVRAVYPGRRGRMPEVERRWSANRFVGKWLKFCLNQGHLFLAGVSRRSLRIDAMVREGRGRPQR